MKKRFLVTVLAASMVAMMMGCGASQSEDTSKNEEAETVQEETTQAAEPESTEEPVSLTIFAAASMTETLTQLGDAYMKENPNVTLSYNFDSSGTLKTQIQEGAECDLFISAGQKQMDELDASADASVNIDNLDFVQEDTRKDILENKVTLCVPEDNKAGINSFADMAAGLEKGDILMAMGNSDVPVGQYTQKILTYYNLDETSLADSGVISYGSNVKEVATQIIESSTDCGVVYCTDAYSEGLTIVDYATEEMCGKVIYPAAVMKNSTKQEAAAAFLDYILTDDSMSVFEQVGFSAVE